MEKAYWEKIVIKNYAFTYFNKTFSLFKVLWCFILRQQMFLLRQEHFGLFCIAIEHLQIETLAEQLLPAIEF